MQFLIDIGLSIVYFCVFLLFCAWTYRFWMMYVNQKALNSIDWIMLEIKLPREINKSPLATEVALASFILNSGVSTKYDRVFKGNLPVFSSLEIASIEGVIHFYIRIQKRFKDLIESNFYAQYPEIEIVEADDYTKLIRYHHLSKDVSMWGNLFRTSKSWNPTNPKTGTAFPKEGKANVPLNEGMEAYSMKADFYPIKTYVDFGLDKDPKEEFKIDPLNQLIETLGSIGRGEHMWYQIIIQDESVYSGKKMDKFYINERTHDHLSLKDMADARKKQIRTSGWNIKGDIALADEFGVPKVIDEYKKNDDGSYEQLFDKEEGKDGKIIRIPKKTFAKYLETKSISKKEMDLTPEEKDEIEIINKKLSKALMVCVVRLIYIAKKENFKGGQIANTLAFPRTFKGVNSFGMNTSDPYDYPWEKFGGKRVAWRTEEMFEEYVEREGFYPHIKQRDGLDKWEDRIFWSSSMKQRKLFRMIFEAIFYPFDHPHADNAFTLNLEELATLWHLPGATAATPTLPRIDSNKGMPPTNLPI